MLFLYFRHITSIRLRRYNGTLICNFLLFTIWNLYMQYHLPLHTDLHDNNTRFLRFGIIILN